VIFGVGYMYWNFTLYEYLGRRVAIYNRYLDPRTDEEKQLDANKLRTNFGYFPRYEPKLHRSLKKRKYDMQNLEETVNDTPQLRTSNKATYKHAYGIKDPEKEEIFYMTLLDKSRVPGVFDYTQPQTFHALFPDVEQDAYVTIGGKKHRKLAISDFSA
jgi:hypothetical protein